MFSIKLTKQIFYVKNTINPFQNQFKFLTTKTNENLQKLKSNEIKDDLNENYRFTLNNGTNNQLTNEQRDFYEKNGFIIIRKLITEDELAQYERRFKDYAMGKIEPNPLLTLQKELNQAKERIDEVNLYKVQELYADDVFFSYCNNKSILDYVEAFCGGPDILAIHSMLINKPPDTGKLSSRHPMHQDLHYFPLRPADRIVGTWTAMELVTKENGCLSAIPGSHMGQHLEHDYPEWEGGVNKLYYGIKNLTQDELDKRVHLEMEKGDCVFFHPLLIHGSGVNRTKGFRKAISCHYASAKNCHYIDLGVDDHLQGKLVSELLEIYKKRAKKFGFSEEDSHVDYKSIWQARARLVRGEDLIH